MDRDYCADLERIADDMYADARQAITADNVDRYFRLWALGCKLTEAVRSFREEPEIKIHFSKGFLERTT